MMDYDPLRLAVVNRRGAVHILEAWNDALICEHGQFGVLIVCTQDEIVTLARPPEPLGLEELMGPAPRRTLAEDLPGNF